MIISGDFNFVGQRKKFSSSIQRNNTLTLIIQHTRMTDYAFIMLD